MQDNIKTVPFGYLATLDLYGCKEGVCDDLSLCYRFLEDITVKLGMTKQSPPFIFKSDADLYPDKAGISGWIPLIESGIQIHTLAPKNFISIDVYSCKLFEVEDLLDFAKSYFFYKEAETNFINRGLNYNDIQYC